LEFFQGRLPEYFLLDGQQRLTALASVLLNRSILPELLSEVEDEMPFIYGNLRRFPREIDATTDGSGYRFPWVLLNHLFDGSINKDSSYQDLLSEEQRQIADNFTQRVRDYQFPVQLISGRDYATVADIFARVNSQGTQLTGAEIHLATIVPRWPAVT